MTDKDISWLKALALIAKSSDNQTWARLQHQISRGIENKIAELEARCGKVVNFSVMKQSGGITKRAGIKQGRKT